MKPTGNRKADFYLGQLYAIELMQFVLINPDKDWIIPMVFRELSKKKQKHRSSLERAFLEGMISFMVKGAKATANGIFVDLHTGRQEVRG